MRTFAASVQSSPTPSVFSIRAQKLVESIDKNVSLSFFFKSFIFDVLQLALFISTTPSLVTSVSTSSLPDVRPLEKIMSTRELADVLTSIESDRYRKLRELNYVHWLEGNQESSAVSSFISENRKIGYWAEGWILRSHDQLQRAETLKFFLLTIKVSWPRESTVVRILIYLLLGMYTTL